MPQLPFTKPANQILISPDDALVVELEVGANATAAEMLPGIVVIADTNAQDVQESGAEAHAYYGVLEVRSDMLITDHYAVGDQCRVIMGPAIVQVLVKTGEDINIGDRLITGGDGLVVEQAAGALGEQGATIGYALEDSGGALGADTLLAIMFLPAVEAQTA